MKREKEREKNTRKKNELLNGFEWEEQKLRIYVANYLVMLIRCGMSFSELRLFGSVDFLLVSFGSVGFGYGAKCT